MAALEQATQQVAANEARGSGDEDFHGGERPATLPSRPEKDKAPAALALPRRRAIARAMKTEESAASLEALQALIERSGHQAGPALADSVAWEPRRMDARELFAFWKEIRLVAMATVGTEGQPHMAPVHATLLGDALRVLVYENAQRRCDVAGNPRVAFTAWDATGAVAMLYGRATEVEGSLRDARPAQNGRPRRVVELHVQLTRVHAMKGRD